MRLTNWGVALALLACGLMPAPAQALLISLTHAQPGQPSFGVRSFNPNNRFFGAAPQTSGGGTLADVFEAAADMWETVLHDDRQINIVVGWADARVPTLVGAGFTSGGAYNEIFINSTFSLGHFVDPTPAANEEFTDYEEDATDFGTGLINSRRGFTDTVVPLAGIDVLTTALHEIGHVLGFPDDQRAASGSSPYVVGAGPYAGTQLPCLRGRNPFDSLPCYHFAVPGALMNAIAGEEIYDRTLISGADLLYVGDDGGFRDLDFSLVNVSTVDEPSPLWLLSWTAPLVAFVRRRRVQHAEKSRTVRASRTAAVPPHSGLFEYAPAHVGVATDIRGKRRCRPMPTKHMA